MYFLDLISSETTLLNIIKAHGAYKLFFIEHFLIHVGTVVPNTIEKYLIPQGLCVKQVTILL